MTAVLQIIGVCACEIIFKSAFDDIVLQFMDHSVYYIWKVIPCQVNESKTVISNAYDIRVLIKYINMACPSSSPLYTTI